MQIEEFLVYVCVLYMENKKIRSPKKKYFIDGSLRYSTSNTDHCQM